MNDGGHSAVKSQVGNLLSCRGERSEHQGIALIRLDSIKWDGVLA